MHARASLEEIDRELQAQEEACESLRKSLVALGLDTRVILGESLLEQMEAIDTRVASHRPARPVGSFIRV